MKRSTQAAALTVALVCLLVVIVGACASTPRRPGGDAPQCRTWVSKDVPKNITDHSTLRSQLPIAASSSYIVSATVQLTITHSWVGDLRARVCSTQGCDATLFDPIDLTDGGTFTWSFTDDAADYAANDGPPYGGTYLPNTPLNMTARRTAGSWYLAIEDTWTGDEGTLDGWSVTLCSSNSLPITYTPTPTATNTATPAPTATWIATPYIVKVYYDQNTKQNVPPAPTAPGNVCTQADRVIVPWGSLTYADTQIFGSVGAEVDYFICPGSGSALLDWSGSSESSRGFQLKIGGASETVVPATHDTDCLSGPGEIWWSPFDTSMSETGVSILSASSPRMVYGSVNWTGYGDNAACQDNTFEFNADLSWRPRVIPTSTPVPTATPICPPTVQPKPWWWIW